MVARLALEGIRRRRGDDGRGFLLSIDSLTLDQGDAIAILGPSGSGKSTLVELLGLALRPDVGRYDLIGPDGARADLAAFWRIGNHEALARMRARHFGYVPQTGALLPFLDVRANIAMPQRLSGRIDPERLAAVAGALGIGDLMRRLPGTLSVGQRQRVAVARAVAHRPAFVLADEPTAALDPANADVVMGLLSDLVRDDGAALVVVTHDAALARRFRLRCLELSCLVKDGRWHSAVPAFGAAA